MNWLDRHNIVSQFISPVNLSNICVHVVTFFVTFADEAGGTQITLLKKQLQDFKEERETLKSAVQRLNSELSNYQATYRPPDPQVNNILQWASSRVTDLPVDEHLMLPIEIHKYNMNHWLTPKKGVHLYTRDLWCTH